MISVITVNRNNAIGLKKTIESVICQAYRDFEFIIIDGASTDESPEIIKEYRNYLKYTVSEPDSGIYNAMNKGILNSSGDYLLFLNSGDWFCDEGVLEKAAPYLKNYDVISGDIDIYDDGKWHCMQSEDKVTIGHFFRLSLYHQATFISRELFNREGLYNEEFQSTGDYEFFIRTLLKNNGSYSHIPVKISNFVADGMSNDPKLKESNAKEWRKSWSLNFSENIFEELKSFNELVNSDELDWAKKINKLLPF